MNWDTSRHFQPIMLVFPRGGHCKTVGTARDAAEALMRDWPLDDGEGFCDAVRICLDVMIGRSAPWELRSAMLRAAGEAGINAITIVH